MEYTISKIFEQIAEVVNAIYVVDVEQDTYVMIKDNENFHEILGDSGTYSEMLHNLFIKTVDKKVAKGPYDAFFQDVKNYTSNLSNKARLRLKDRDITISIAKYRIEENKTVILITEIEDQIYQKSIFQNQQANALKSAFLFSMKVDLNTDECGSMSMSEVDDEPMVQANIRYSTWRHFILDMFLDEDKNAFLEMTDPEYLRKNLGPRMTKSMDCQMMNIEGKFIWVKLIFNRITTGNPDDFCFLFMVENIHESHMQLLNELKKYENLANTDSLTGLLNRGSIEVAIDETVAGMSENEIPVSMIMFDIDHFKTVNDTYGHAIGDTVLKMFAKIASTYLLPRSAKLGRWGGEEFIAVLENVSLDTAVSLAENLRVLFEQHHFETVGTITSSFGVVQVREQEDAKDAKLRVDSALYKAKELGRNQVVVG